MTDRPRPKDTTPQPSGARRYIDEELLARAAKINESVAGEFAERAVSPLENPVLERMTDLGVETDAAVGGRSSALIASRSTRGGQRLPVIVMSSTARLALSPGPPGNGLAGDPDVPWSFVRMLSSGPE